MALVTVSIYLEILDFEKVGHEHHKVRGSFFIINDALRYIVHECGLKIIYLRQGQIFLLIKERYSQQIRQAWDSLFWEPMRRVKNIIFSYYEILMKIMDKNNYFAIKMLKLFQYEALCIYAYPISTPTPHLSTLGCIQTSTNSPRTVGISRSGWCISQVNNIA